MRKRKKVVKKKPDRAAIGRRSKNKGNAFEREVAKWLSSELGIEFRRVPASGGLDLKGDICYSDFTKKMPLIIDTKNNKSLMGASLRKELDKTIEDAEKAEIPGKFFLVLHNHNSSEDYALVPMALFIEFLKKLKIF